MDPTANLKAQLELAQKMMQDYDDPEGNGIDQDDANQLAELVDALDKWVRGGGFLPEPWQNAKNKGA